MVFWTLGGIFTRVKQERNSEGKVPSDKNLLPELMNVWENIEKKRPAQGIIP